LATGFTATGAAAGSAPKPPHLMVGAYYYSWNPENLAEGTLRAHLVPSQQPPDALINNANPAVADRSITEAKRAGLSFFALDWWPLGPSPVPLSVRLKSDYNVGDFLKAPNLGSFKFCMFYETWNLNFDPTRETTPVTPAVEAHFDADMLLFAHTFFANPSYLRIDGRPVVDLYLTRTLTGDVAGMISGARAALERVGYDPFFIGDEVFWRVTQLNPPASGPALTLTPQVARIDDFDAITAYTMYLGAPVPSQGLNQNFVGYPGRTPIVRDERELLNEYRAASDGRVPVLPDIAPGFNDRGVRLPTNHPAQPRQWLPGAGPASTLDHLFRQVALPEVDPRLPIVFVTAWDEWNEDTGVEPVPGTATSKDDSPTGQEYTQGYTYGGEGDSALVVLRRDIALGDRELEHR
jgi:glycoprotein endo-alpha-1,2-mannosidase